MTRDFRPRAVCTYLYMMFPLSRAFILPHCPFSKASCRGQKSPKRLKVISQTSNHPTSIRQAVLVESTWRTAPSPPTLAARTALLTSSAEEAEILQMACREGDECRPLQYHTASPPLYMYITKVKMCGCIWVCSATWSDHTP